MNAREAINLLTVSIVLAVVAGAARTAHSDVANGNFSAGNTGFASGYSYSATTGNGGQYTVGSNPSSFNPGASTSFGDHTTGTGLMLIADGAATANTPVWQESPVVTPGTLYTFSFYAADWGNDNHNNIDPSPSTLVATANGTQTGSTLSLAGQTNGTWFHFTSTINSGSLTALSLAITDSNLVGTGNDFALDDISLTPTPEPGAMTLLVGSLAVAMLLRRRRAAIGPRGI